MKVMTRVLYSWCFSCCFFWPTANGQILPDGVEMQVPQAGIVGQGRFSMAFWDIYEATLYAPQGRWQALHPFALKLTYFRNFSGEDIALRSLQEMRKQGLQQAELEVQWLALMTGLFPDVSKNHTLVGVLDAKQSTHFYYENQWLGQISDPEFGRWFFNIWLAETTSAPKLRQALLGIR
jgi:hypothetical protein